MAVYSASALDAVYVQAQAANTPRTIPNAAGTWTSAGSILARHESLQLTSNRAVADRPDKTGTKSRLVGITARTSGSFTYTGPLVPNGAAGTAPDLDPILQSLFGQPATIVAATSATYNFLDSGFIPISFFRYNKSGGSSPTNFYAGGCLVQRLTLHLGGDYLMMTVEGKCVVVGDSAQFASYTGNDAIAKLGLTTFPAQPVGGAPNTVSGTPINGFGGTATFDGQSMAELRGATNITFNSGLDFVEDAFQDGYPFAIVSGRRSVTIGSLRFIDSDTSALNNLKTKAFTKSAINISIAVNNTAGSIVTINLNALQLQNYNLVENGPAFDIVYNGESPAHATAVANTNDATLVFT